MNTAEAHVLEPPASQFSIAANATLQERRTRTLKQGDTFGVFDHRGDIGVEVQIGVGGNQNVFRPSSGPAAGPADSLTG